LRARMSARLGADFHKLWTASAISTIGDGVTLVAGPLLVASRTDDPALVAGAVFAQQLPWLLFSLVSGVYVDRLDRQRLIVIVNLLRGLALAALAVAIGPATIPFIYAVLFVLGAGETVADTASAARLPGIVPADKLAAANTRLMATFTIGNQFLAKPLGAYLFVTAAALPFGLDAFTFFAAAALVAAMRPVPGPAPRPPTRLRVEVAEGLRWLWRHRLLRTLAISMGVGNVVLCGAFAILVLYARRRLGLSEVGYGSLLITFAVGGLLGTAMAGRLQARFGATALLRVGLIVETATHVALAVVTDPWPAAATLVVFGAHTMVWGVIVTTLIQRSVPDRLRGRVNSVYALILTGGAALGSLLGGVFVRGLGITAPFWIAAAVMLLTTATAWRPLRGAADVSDH
jgi:predicted MFS family arabinose efflux permease